MRDKEILHNDKGVISLRKHTILKVGTPTNRVLKDMRQKMIHLKGEVDKSTIIFGDLDTLFQYL